MMFYCERVAAFLDHIQEHNDKRMYSLARQLTAFVESAGLIDFID